jgi:hypothetical protein
MRGLAVEVALHISNMLVMVEMVVEAEVDNILETTQAQEAMVLEA